jgi:putative inorganic carbon (hco3(-)) transporter
VPLATSHPLPLLRHPAWQTLVAAAAALCVAGLVLLFEPRPVLTTLTVLGAAVAMLVRPDLATLLVVLLLYLNVPAILTQRHGVPEAAAGAFIVLLGAPLLHLVIVKRRGLKADTTLLLMFALLGALLLSSLWALDKGIALARVRGYLMEGLLLYWLIVNVIRDLPTLKLVVATLLVAGGLMGGLCLYQDLTGSYRQEFGGLAYRNYLEAEDVVTPGKPKPRRQWDRAQGPLNEPNRFAQVMIVLLPLALFMYRSGRSTFARRAAAAAGGLILIGVLLTLSRGAVVTLVFMALVLIPLRWVRPSRVAVAAVLLIALLPLVAPAFLARIISIADVTYLLSDDPSRIRQADGAIRGRTTEMLSALHVFLDHPLVGVGPGQFAPYYFEIYGQKSDVKFRDIRRPRRAHTLYFEIAAELGIIGLTAFLAIVGMLLRRLWQWRTYWLPRDREAADLASAFALSIMAYLVTAIFLHLSYQRYYWFLIALASAAVHVLRARAESERVQPQLGRTG